MIWQAAFFAVGDCVVREEGGGDDFAIFWSGGSWPWRRRRKDGGVVELGFKN